MKFFKTTTFGWIINGLAVLVFITTGNHVLEIILGLMCVYAAYLGVTNKDRRLLFSSIIDAIWMFAWGFGFMGDYAVDIMSLI